MLYEAEVRGRDPVAVLADRLAQADPPVAEFTVELVEGVAAHRAEIDDLLAATAQGWSLERMPVVDRNLLRLGAFELLHRPDVPPGVAIDEAVALAAALSTDDSPRFVNGVLAALAAAHPPPPLSPSGSASG